VFLGYAWHLHEGQVSDIKYTKYFTAFVFISFTFRRLKTKVIMRCIGVFILPLLLIKLIDVALAINPVKIESYDSRIAKNFYVFS
jgi:hypothetical protein